MRTLLTSLVGGSLSFAGATGLIFTLGGSLPFSLVASWTLPIQGSGNFELLFLLDPISGVFLSSVSLVAGAVFIFSTSYMGSEVHFLRFHLILLSFVASMALLIVSPNLLSLLLGWDGLGVTSFLLVIYFQSAKSYNAGMLTVLSNRVGDLLILAAIGLSLEEGTWNIFSNSSSGASPPYLLLLIVALAAFTKSAQIPFSAWLPAAMAAPTPVSSLVHSSTLVTAGVYLLIRLSASAAVAPLLLILMTGAATMLMAGGSALYEVDMKKVVALSTLSQLGLMMSAVGLGESALAFLHLLSHAYFKALLFMAVGNMIHLADDFQDMRKAAVGASPAITLTSAGVANFSLAGLPFMSGFYTKDAILESGASSLMALVTLVVFYLATALTAAYSLRMVVLAALSSLRRGSFGWEEEGSGTALCYLVLLPWAVGGGYLLVGHHFGLTEESLAVAMKNFTALVILSGLVFITLLRGISAPLTPRQGSYSLGAMWAIPALSSYPPLVTTLTGSALGRWSDLTWNALTPLGGVLGIFFGKHLLSDNSWRINFFGAPFLFLGLVFLFMTY